MAKRNAHSDSGRRPARRTASDPPAARPVRTLRARPAGRSRAAAAKENDSADAAAPSPGPSRSRTRAARLPDTVLRAIRAARDKKALDVVVLDLRHAGGFTDYFVICTGANSRQIATIADAVKTALQADLGERPALTEGRDKSEWILLDYFDFVVHIFSPDYRAFYALERLWGNAERLEVPEEAPVRV